MRDPARAASIAESLPAQEGSKVWNSLNNVYTFGILLGPLLGLLILSLATYGRFVWKVPTQGIGINSFIWLFIHCLILVFALDVLANSSQFFLGCCFGEVMMSTISPIFS